MGVSGGCEGVLVVGVRGCEGVRGGARGCEGVRGGARG